MKATYCPGVSETSPIYGFNSKEFNDALRAVTGTSNDDLIVIAEANPAIEWTQTRNFMLDAFITLLKIYAN
jgi:hypothetical protein